MAEAPLTARDDWDRHWAEYAEANAQNPAQEYRRRLVLSLLGEETSPARVLDIGCGSGELAATVRTAFPDADICGLDTSAAALALARRKVPGATFVQRDLLAPGKPEPRFRNWATHAICSEVLEHLENPGELLRNVKAYLAPGSLLVVTVPGGPISVFDRHIGHRVHYKRDQLAALLVAAGFQVERTLAAGFPFFNLYRLAVMARGERLVEDFAATGRPARLDLVAMRVFDALFRLNLRSSPLGWQTVAVARFPSG